MVIFLTSFDYPSRFAHPIHGFYMARSLASILKGDFLFVINSILPDNEHLLSDIKYVRPFGRYGRRVKRLHLRALGYFLWLPLLFLRSRGWVYVNDPILMMICAVWKPLIRFKVLFECHGFYAPIIESIAYKYADHIVFTTRGLCMNASKKYALEQSKTSVLPNAADISRFENVTISKHEIRAKLNLPEGMRLIGYTGRFKPLGMDKGLLFLIRSLKVLPQDMQLVGIGGTKLEIEEYSAAAEAEGVRNRVILIEHVPTESVPLYTKALDVLAYVPTETNSFFSVETSPMKLFEYMASRRPIIASNIPPVREILSDNTAYLIKPGDTAAFTAAVDRAFSNEGERKALSAFETVAQNTWTARAYALLNHMIE